MSQAINSQNLLGTPRYFNLNFGEYPVYYHTIEQEEQMIGWVASRKPISKFTRIKEEARILSDGNQALYQEIIKSKMHLVGEEPPWPPEYGTTAFLNEILTPQGIRFALKLAIPDLNLQNMSMCLSLPTEAQTINRLLYWFLLGITEEQLEEEEKKQRLREQQQAHRNNPWMNSEMSPIMVGR